MHKIRVLENLMPIGLTVNHQVFRPQHGANPGAQDVTGSMRRDMPSSIKAVVLGRLAIDLAWQGKGLGRTMPADTLRRALRASADLSARLVIVHAISPATEAFYLHQGFTRLPVETAALALDLVKFQKAKDKG